MKIIALAVALAAVAFALCSGPAGLGPPDDATVFLRLARVCLGFVVGAALSATGAALQALLRNPLADPYVLGVSGGAAMGASLFTATTSLLAFAPPALVLSLGLPGAGIVGAFCASALLVLFVAHDKGEGTVLVGIVLNAFSWAVVAVVRALVPASAGLSVWLIGSIGYPDVLTLGVAGGVTLVGVLALMAVSGSLSILRGGDEEAVRLGVDVNLIRVVVVVAASALVGVAVGTSGVIGFVGLLVPHAVRRLFTVDERGVIPLSALLGGALLCAFDGVARLGFGLFGSEIPVGAACALLGAPAFAVLLWRSR